MLRNDRHAQSANLLGYWSVSRLEMFFDGSYSGNARDAWKCVTCPDLVVSKVSSEVCDKCALKTCGET